MSKETKDETSRILQLPGGSDAGVYQVVEQLLPQVDEGFGRSQSTVIRVNGNMYRICGVDGIC